MKNLSIYTLIAMLSGIGLVFDVSLTAQFAIPKLLILRLGTLALCLIWLQAQRKGQLQPLNRFILYAGIAFGSWQIVVYSTSLLGYTALHGVYGWYNGLFSHLNYLFLFYLIAVLPIDSLKVLKAFVIVMGISAVYAVIQTYQLDWSLLKKRDLPIPIFSDGRPSSTIGNPVSMAVCLMLALPFSICFFLKSNKWLWGFLTALLLFGIAVSQARAVVLAFGFTSLILVIVYFRKFFTKNGYFYGVIAVIILSLVFLLFQNFINPDTQKRWNPKMMMQEQGIASRIEYAKISYKMLTDKPIRFLTGIGQDNFAILYPLYRTPEAIKAEQADKIPTQTHNSYLNFIVEGGIPLLLFYLAFIISVLKNINRNNRLLGMAFTASILCFLLQSFTGWVTIPVMVFFFVIMGISAQDCKTSLTFKSMEGINIKGGNKL